MSTRGRGGSKTPALNRQYSQLTTEMLAYFDHLLAGPNSQKLFKPIKQSGDRRRNLGVNQSELVENWMRFPRDDYYKQLVVPIYREIKDATEIKAKNAAEILAAKARYCPPKPDNGAFRISFMNIGSGDCIFMATPNGNVIVVDCGQRKRPEGYATEGEFRKDIGDHLESFVGQASDTSDPMLYALILTHPDLDHYKEVPTIIKPKVTNAHHVFYALDKGEYSENTTSTTLDELQLSISQIGIDEADKLVVKQTSYTKEELRNAYAFHDHKVQILGKRDMRAGETKLPVGWDEQDCAIYLLAAGVSANSGTDAERKNGSSIVTMVEVHGRKILLTGDATTETEAFLLRHHRGVLSGIDLLHLEHHGSGTHHASDGFVNMVKPRLAVISAGPHEGDWNPRLSTINKYRHCRGSRICTGTDKHSLIYADRDQRWEPAEELTSGIYSTHSTGHLCFWISNDGGINWSVRANEQGTDYEVTYTLAMDGTVTHNKVPVDLTII